MDRNGQVSFTIDNAANLVPLAWTYNGGTTETVVYLDDETNQIFATSSADLIFEALPVGSSNIRFIQVDPATQQVTIKNFGDAGQDISTYRLCSNFNYTFGGIEGDAVITLIAGDYDLSPGEEVTIQWTPATGFRIDGDDMGIYLPAGSFGDEAFMVDFMQYLSDGNGRESVAVAKGIWSTADFVDGNGPFDYIGDGTDTGVTFWEGQASTCPVEGDLIITEIMKNPGVTTDANGEWFEVYNTTGADIDMLGMTIGDAGSDSHVIDSSVIVPAGGFAVLASNGDFATNGGVTANYEYSGIAMGNGSDEVIITCDGTEIDAVFYTDGTFPDTNGATLTLNPDSFDGMDNDDGGNWYNGTSSFGDGDTGTPGAENDVPAVFGCTNMDACNYDSAANVDNETCILVGDECDDNNPDTENDVYTACDVCEGTPILVVIEGCMDITACNYNSTANTAAACVFAEGCDDCSGETDGTGVVINNPEIGDVCNDNNPLTENDEYITCDVCEGTIIVNCPNAGDLIITEIMKNPSAVADADGEWFEVYNTTGSDIEMNGMFIEDQGSESHQIMSSLIVPANGFVVLGNNADFATNGGVVVDYEYSNYNLSNGSSGDEVVIVCDGNIIDVVAYNNSDFPNTAGTSMTLNPDNFDSAENDAGTNWYNASSTYGDGDSGTPNAENDIQVVLGCIDTEACNFDSLADSDDGSCTYPGCIDTTANNYDSTAGCDDQSCTYDAVLGCIDTEACNFDSLADTDDGSCTYPGCIDTTANNYDSTAGCDDQSCTYDVLGCIDTTACNFDSLADTDDGSCTYPGCNDSAALNYDSAAGCDDGSCEYPLDLCNETVLPLACGDEVSSTTIGLTNTPPEFCGTSATASGEWYSIVGDGEEATFSLCGSDYDTKLHLFSGTCDAYECVAGNDDSCGLQSEITSVLNEGEVYFLYVSAFGTTEGNYTLTVTCITDVLPGCIDTTACNFDSLANTDDGSCTYPGCLDSTASNFDSTAGCEDNTLCTYAPDNDACAAAAPVACGDVLAGSTDGATSNDAPEACGTTAGAPGVWYSFAGDGSDVTLSLCSEASDYDTKIGVYSGVCGDLTCVTGNDDFCGLQSEVTFTSIDGEGYLIYVYGFNTAVGNFELSATCVTVVPGCMDTAACNYDSTATNDDGSCTYPGCTDSTALNYDSTAGCDDESCSYEVVPGCTDSAACNYDPSATEDDGSCEGGLWYLPVDFDASETAPMILSCGPIEGYFLAGDQDCAQATADADSYCFETDWDSICQDAYNEFCGIVPGCVDTAACNYDSTASEDDGSCTYPGCTDSAANNYDSTAGCDDQSCTYDGVPGCMDTAACNYDSTATVDDSSCTYPGCLDTTATNFDSTAGCEDNTLCTYAPDNDLCAGAEAIACGGSVTGSTTAATGGDAPEACGTTAGAPGVWYSYTGDGSDVIFSLCSEASDYDTKISVYSGVCDDLTCVTGNDDFCGLQSEVSIEGAEGAFLIYVYGFNTAVGNFELSATCSTVIEGCLDTTACNYDSTANAEDGSCTYPGCLDTTALNYDSAAGCDSGLCEYEVIEGCMDTTACNYNSTANADDGSCTYPGCTDSTANNYDSTAGCDDESCEYDAIPGCMSSTACNYDSTATTDDGSCDFGDWYLPLGGGPIIQSCLPVPGYFYADQTCAQFVVDGDPFCVENDWDDVCQEAYDICLGLDGCTDTTACNYDSTSTVDDGSCTYPGCMDTTALNYDSTAGCDSGACEYDVIEGCNDTAACNYDSTAEVNDGSCTYPGCMNVNANNYDSTAGCDDGSCTFDALAGCTDPEACNYDSAATIDDGSCLYAVDLVFVNPPVDMTVECVEEVPAPVECIVEGAESTEVFTSTTGVVVEVCELGTAFGPGNDWAIWLPSLVDAGVAPTANWNFISGGTMEVYDDGTANITGTIANDFDGTLQFEVDFWFENQSDWDQWSNVLGRSYKDDMGLATGGMLYEDWTYYEMANGFSQLTGTGALTGSSLAMYHMPSSYFFGFQCGMAANNKNANNGMSGWFTYSGSVAGVQIHGNGDLNADKTCTPVNDDDCINNTEVTYVWRATDVCGNAITTTQVITVLDITPPTFVNAPADMTIECSDVLPTAPTVTAVDNCVTGATVTYEGEVVNNDDPCNVVISRQWRAIDECDNVSVHIQMITVVDTTNPILTVPADASYECHVDYDAGTATATDNCDDDVTITIDVVESGDACEMVITRTFTAEDNCENTATGTQTITIVDTTAPVFDAYEMQLYLNCEDVSSAPALSATDNCDPNVELSYTEVLGSGGCMGSWHQIWTATDECGNTATAERYITVLDNTPPVINNPADETVECDAIPTSPGADGIVITDNCALDIEVTYTEEITPGDCDDSYTITWTWVAVDYCENESTAMTVITVVDTTNPTWTTTCPSNITIECDQVVPEAPEMLAEDNCDDDVEVEYTESTEAGDCPQESVITRMYRGFDDCGNEVLCQYTITIVDTTAPELTVPENASYECDVDYDAGDATATDNCGLVTITVDEVEAGDSCDMTITRTFTATDECNNSTTGVQVITISDTTAPTIVIDGDLTIECSEEVPVTTVTTMDNCNEVTVATTEDINEDDWCAVVITRTFTPTDVCGNEGETATQVITIVDTTAPVFVDFLPQIEMPCDNISTTITATATDNCHEPTVTFNDEMVSGGCVGNIIRTYTATDMCDNSSTAVQIINLTDEIAPEFTNFPTDVTVECDAVIPTSTDVEGTITYTDNCTEVTLELTGTETVAGDCPQNYSVEYTWTITDECDNSSSMTWTVSVEDTTAPELTVPENASYECDETYNAGDATATDNCGLVTITVDEVEAGDSCDMTITRTFTATDECNNSTTGVQVITVSDTTAPTVTPAASVTIECDETAPEATYTTSDNCNDVTVEITESTNEDDWCNVILTRTYVPTDACGNEGEAMTQTITFVDTTAPEFVDFLPQIEMPCDNISTTITATATDNCHEPTVTFEDEMVSGGCAGNIIRTYTATDMCDNSSTAVQIINLTDDIAPEFTNFPVDVTVECDAAIPTSTDVEGTITYTDNCTDVTLELTGTETVAGDCPQNYSVEYTWTITDGCDNSTSMTWTVSVEDTTAPELTVPENASYECDEDYTTEDATATDNCGLVTITVDEVEAGDSCDMTITRTFTATDECNNSTTGVQVITISDTTAPTVTPAASVTIECDETAPEATYTTSDNCNDVTVEITESTNEDDWCNVILTRIYVPTDACGNEGEAMTQTITFVDTTAPEFVDFLPQIEMPCDNISTTITATATDNCHEPTVTFEDEMVSGGCAGNIIRTYTATDMCDNSSTAVQIINLTDDIAPEFTNFPVDVTVECDAAIPTSTDVEGTITFTDNCTDVTLELTGTETVAGDCPQNYSVEYTWTITDGCDNSTSMTWTVSVEDTTAPELTVPENASYECDEDYTTEDATATDNCGLVTITVDEVEAGDSCDMTITRTFTATDECNNSTTGVQVITISDNTAPTIVIDGDVTIECTDEVPVTTVTTMDNCNEVTVATTEDINEDDWCAVVITRTFTPTDVCGNEGETATQVITIVDTTAPVFVDFEPQIEMPCDNISTTITATATDNCHEPTVTFEDEMVSGGCAGNIIRTYTATDMCDNSVTAVQIINLTDDTAPEFTNFPTDVSVECDATIPSSDDVAGTITYTDDCTEVTLELTGTETAAGDCPQNYSVAYTWTITDGCDNSTSMTWTVNVADTTAPELTVPENASYECDEDYDAGDATATDNCGLVTITIDEVEVGDSCDMTITRTFTATDECNNSTTGVQVITVSDTTAPTLTVAGDVTIDCSEIVPEEDYTVSDNCNAVDVDVTEVIEGGDYCYTITRTYIATDACDNASEPMTQVITVVDNTAPVLNGDTTDIVVECAEDVPSFDTWDVTDNCDPNPTVSSSTEILTQDDCGNYTAIVTCTAMDACGNESSVSFNITVQDNTAPVFDNEPADLVLDCSEDAPTDVDCPATDNCIGDITYDYNEEFIGEQPDPEAEDDCVLSTPNDNACETSDPWALTFTSGYLNSPMYEFYTLTDGQWLNYGTTAHLTATVVSTTNANAGWEIDVWFENGMDYNSWMTQDNPTGVKFDCLSGADVANWVFYLISEGEATLTGWGDFAGSALTLTHAPSNGYFGYQVGVGANNQSEEYGSGGWFSYEGNFVDSAEGVSETVNGAGDISVGHDCCPQYYIERTWTATDCTGNSVSYTQTITFEGDGTPEPSVFEELSMNTTKGDFEIISITPNPTENESRILFGSNIDTKLTLEVYDMTGRSLGILFQQDVQASNRYVVNYNAANLENGSYFVRLRSNSDQVVEKLMVSK